ncbi:MAG: Gfo/Idh/MocA family protein, partial [Acidobacteriota bacterium]
MQKIRTAMIGTGFMGIVHTEAIRRLGNIEVATVAASSEAKAKAFAEQMYIPAATADWESVMRDPGVQAVHICTPNALHHPMAKLAIENGK